MDVGAGCPLPESLHETTVTFAGGAVSGTGTVLRVESLTDDQYAVVLDRTPFHPVDHSWPDQPGDRGRLGAALVSDTWMGAVGPDGVLLVGEQIPVRRGEPGWVWCVVHGVVEDLIHRGDEVSLQVDAGRRARLSASHTGCHLAALALNAAAAPYWRKEVRVDSLGSPDLDQLAMVSSRMDEHGSTDVYRFGKSLRKKGFDGAGFLDDLPEILTQVGQTLRDWVASGAAVTVLDGGDGRITALRRWTCDLPEGMASIPCGGTHVGSVSELGRLTVDYEVAPDGAGLEVRAIPRPPLVLVP